MEEAKAPALPASLWPGLLAIAFNLVPVAGVLFWGWSAFALIFLYWLENVVIGVRTLGAMAATAFFGGALNAVGALSLGAFFTVHYGIFCFVHGSFVVTLFGRDMLGDTGLDLLGAGQTLFKLLPNLKYGLASIVIWQVVQLVVFVVRGGARAAAPMELMGAPYPRIVILHITIIAGGALLMAMGQPLAGLVMLTLIKTGFDVAEAMGMGPRFKIGSLARRP